jgi:hypothetical protein
MKHPLRENLEVAEANGTDWIYCGKCQFRYCRADENWREFCRIRLLPPAKAGKLMSLLDGQYLLRQFYCPSCAALVDTDLIEAKQTA